MSAGDEPVNPPPASKAQSPGAETASLVQGFKNWAEAAKELNALPPRPTTGQQSSFLAGLKGSPNPRAAAFEALLWLHDSRERLRKHSWLTPHLLEILQLDPQALEPNNCNDPGELVAWVRQKLEPLRNAKDWSEFVGSSQHFGVLGMILLPSRA